MVIRTYFDKNNTIVKNQPVNTGLNPITELFYGGGLNGSEKYSRFLFHFDETRLREIYSGGTGPTATGGTVTDLTKLKHTLRLTNTGAFDKDLLNGTMGSKLRASSFDLILFKIDQLWDNGVGYDYDVNEMVLGETAFSFIPSNWTEAQTGVVWSGGSGVYSGSPSGITIATQHFDKGNENIEMDITDYVNGVITGDTNYGLGIAFDRGYELMNTSTLNYVGFFTNNTQTFYEPYIETIYDSHIKDDRNNFFMDKPNKLYLYVNIGGQPTDLEFLPTCIVNGSGLTTTNVAKGVYCVEAMVPSVGNEVDTLLNDVWSNLYVNGINIPDITLDFVLKDPVGYYGIGSADILPKKVAVSIGGLLNKEKIKRGDIRKVIVSTRIPYTVEQTQTIDDVKYRLYVSEGPNELTVIDFQPVEMTSNYNYFLLDTQSLIPNTYYLDVLVTSNLEVTTIKNAIQFDIVNQVDLRKGQ